MAIDARTFEALTPSRFITFTFPNPAPHTPSSPSLLRVAVLDSPTIQSTADQPPRVAAMLVPEHREHDWIFSTESGHLHLLLNSPGICRLVLIGNVPVTVDFPPVTYNRPIYDDEYTIYRAKLEASLLPLLIALSPKSCIRDDSLFDIPFLSYEDNVKQSGILEKCIGSCVGEMLVEDVEIECNNDGSKREFRRRLIFKRMPNLIQTEIRIVPVRGLDLDSFGIGEIEFELDLGVLVHPYLAPMVAGLSLVGDRMEERIQCGFKLKALCLGVGGGALLGFLRTQLGFEVIGVEEDMEVVKVAKLYFGLKDDETIQIGIGDGIEMIKNLSDQAGKALRVSKPKRQDTLESTWKTITEGRPMPLTRHLRKSDTWETRHNSPHFQTTNTTPQKMKKSETFHDHGSTTSNNSSLSPSHGSGKLRKDPSLSQDELNRRVEAFINKFNEEMRLQRQESLNQYHEMIKRGAN